MVQDYISPVYSYVARMHTVTIVPRANDLYVQTLVTAPGHGGRSIYTGMPPHAPDTAIPIHSGNFFYSLNEYFPSSRAAHLSCKHPFLLCLQ